MKIKISLKSHYRNMKKILLISDTHGHLDQKIIKYINEADEVWHAGDIGTTEVDTSSDETEFN